MKYSVIQLNCSTFPVVKMCHVLEVIKNPESTRKTENRKLLSEIKKVFKKSRRTYGSPRITSSLHDNGIRVSRNRVAREMREHCIRAKTKCRFKITTQSSHNYPYSPNLLKQQFFAAAVNLVWLSDITYIRTLEGWLYLRPLLTCWQKDHWLVDE